MIKTIIKEINKTNPITTLEAVSAGLLAMIGFIALLNPESLLVFRNIDPDSTIEGIEGYWALALFFSPIVPVLATMYYQSISGEDSKQPRYYN